jgi:ATP-dependent exoDNAse (exonuclease V) beta subunit
VPETAPAPDPVPGEAVIFDWAGEGARAAGSVVHRLLEAWGRDGLPAAGELPPGVADYARTALREQGLSGTPLADAAQRVERALAATVADPRGRWLYDPTHNEARSELALTAQLDGQLVALVVDRTFVAADGVRWIVDFKTSDHRGGGLEAFLDREQARYRDQLERYARALAALDPRPQRLALYFPLVGGWREWEVEG